MKTILITGISRGIGRALAEKFLSAGDFVIGTSTSGITKSTHKNLIVFQLDLSKPESIKACAKKIGALHKGIDILINNAAIWSGIEDDPIVHINDLRKVLEVDLIGTIDFAERVISRMNQNGHIINISSSSGSLERTDHSNYPDYKISKAGLNMFTRILALRLKRKATVSSVHPGWVRTDMGGADADMEPTEAAEHIFKLACSKVESGQFWFKGKKFPW